MGLRDLAQRWRILKKSDAALRGEDMDALRGMDHEALVLLAKEALDTVVALDDEGYDYLIEALDDHVEGPGPGHHVVGKMTCMWVIAQADGGDNTGGFNKWSKVVGGCSVPRPDAALFEKWSDAKAAHSAMCGEDKFRANCFKIYPVIAIAGNEPRTTNPREL